MLRYGMYRYSVSGGFSVEDCYIVGAQGAKCCDNATLGEQMCHRRRNCRRASPAFARNRDAHRLKSSYASLHEHITPR
jgi:hypothetical protein